MFCSNRCDLHSNPKTATDTCCSLHQTEAAAPKVVASTECCWQHFTPVGHCPQIAAQLNQCKGTMQRLPSIALP
jgi:hypothetical protein